MPGGKTCRVAMCKSNSKKARQSGAALHFFTFPKDPVCRKEWVRKCDRKENWDPGNQRVCSLHFTPEDYEDEMHARLMGTQPKKLKKTAIPSLLLHPAEKKVEAEDATVSTQRKKLQQQERTVLVEALLQTPSKSEQPVGLASWNLEGESYCDISGVPSSSKETELDIVKRQLTTLQQENERLKEKIQLHETNEETLRHNIRELEKQIKEGGSSEDKVKLAFKDCLTANQVEMALQKKTKARWTTEELSRAFTLRYFSKRCYIYLRETLHYPLPGLSTLQQWAANIHLRNGILDDVLRIMDTAGKTKTNLGRTTVLSFDEVKVSSFFEYDQKEDAVVGPHSYMQVIMARGLFDKWKQPIYIGFDQKVTKNLLETVITRLHHIKYNVVACTSDCGGGNQGLWRELHINVDKTSMEHPVTKNHVYFFADVPHLLKLLRNWFLDVGFLLQSGEVLNKEPVKKLLESTRTEISSCHKLTPLHLTCEKAQRQNVKLAAQLFSNTTATALKQYLPGEDKKCAEHVGEFFQLVNMWFDIMNSYTPAANVPSKKPYGLNLELQNEVLDKMVSTMRGMVCAGKTTMQVFQKGIIISTQSVEHLFKDLQKQLGVKYILTHRLNQDCLENFFSQLRTRGGLHDHPSPLNALYRVRMILLGKNPGIVQSHSNVEASPALDQEEYLLASTLKHAAVTVDVPQLPTPLEDVADNESSTSSSSTASLLSGRALSEKDGLVYLAGYLAKRHLKDHPYLGQYTHKSAEAMMLHSYSMPSWVQSLSFGGLIQPSTAWTTQITQMEKYFQKFHQDQLKRSKNICKKTVHYIMKKVTGIPNDLIQSFCRQRIFVRMKYLNLKREEAKLGKRKASSEAARKSAKKLKKIVN